MNGILAVEKPAGVTSSNVVLQLQAIFDSSDVFAADLQAMKKKVLNELTSGTRWSESKIANRVKRTKIKVGHGGTLDPLASGVLIIGVGTGTKKLNYYLSECTKTYEARAVLGQSTTTGDSEGDLVTQTEFSVVTLDGLRKAASKFVGDIKQTPPIYSALKVDGKPLYEYARQGIPLPKPIKPREVKVFSLNVHDDFGPHESHGFLKSTEAADSMDKAVFNNPTLNDHDLCYSTQFTSNPDTTDEEKVTKIHPVLVDPSKPVTESPPVFHMTAAVGSGTYIRSIISDIGRAVGSSAFMVELIRLKQANWELGKNVFKIEDFTARDQRVWGPVLKKVFDSGDSVNLAEEFVKHEESFASEKNSKDGEDEEDSGSPGESQVNTVDAEDTESESRLQNQRDEEKVKRRKVGIE